ncbi:hypothetical protein PIB30_094076, partial [Stylosanthes scabra]|nr:hypothetical protein [Stylosanthes scabra]
WELRMNDLGMGHAWLLAVKMPSAHMRGLPRLCVDLVKLGDVRVTFEVVQT